MLVATPSGHSSGYVSSLPIVSPFGGEHLDFVQKPTSRVEHFGVIGMSHRGDVERDEGVRELN